MQRLRKRHVKIVLFMLACVVGSRSDESALACVASPTERIAL